MPRWAVGIGRATMNDASHSTTTRPGLFGRSPRRTKLRKVMIGKREVLTSGLEPSFWNDVYHVAMTAGWPAFMAGIAAAYVVINASFAALYWLSPDSVANSHGNLESLFYFSVETLTTVGYGEMSPQTRYGHLVVSVETFTGLFVTASMLGLIFARLSRPRARLLFARGLAIGPYEGRRTLSARVANARLNVISSANARLWVLIPGKTAEGVMFRRFEELKLIRSENPTFVLSWTILHLIDEMSPLDGVTAEGLASDDLVFVLNVTGYDETSAQTVQAREYYLAGDVHFDHRYADVLFVRADGTTMLDYQHFHTVEPIASGAADVEG